MTKFNSTHKFTAGAAFGAALLFSMLSFGSSAEAASVFSCKGTSLKKVADCCEQIVKENGRPLWMTQAGASCRSVAFAGGNISVAESTSHLQIKRLMMVALAAAD